MGTIDATICIPTFGTKYWRDLGTTCLSKVAATVKGAGNVWCEHFDPDEDDCSIAGIRNYMLKNVDTEYVIFLDADDTLHPDFLTEISKSNADMIVPAVRYHHNRSVSAATIPMVGYCMTTNRHPGRFCGPDCLDYGNYAVIGTAARVSALQAVGGFHDWTMYEDWDLWLRVAKNGASFENVPSAIYEATFNETSRNRAPSQAVKLETHRAIARANGVWVP